MNRWRFTIALFCSLTASVGAVLALTEIFHRAIVIPKHEPRRIHLDAYLSAPKPYVALGSSQMNMSLNIDRPDFYNLAWRGETIAEQWLKFRIILRESRLKPLAIFLEVNAPTMVSAGSKNPFFFYAEYVTKEDWDVIESSGVSFQWPLLTQMEGPYRRSLKSLAQIYLTGGNMSPTPETLNYEILKNGYSYNIIKNRNFPAPLKKAESSLRVHPNFDFYFRLILAEARAHQIRITLVSTPFYSTLREAFEGPTISARSYIAAACAEFGVEYVDYSRFSDDPEDYWNEDHLSLSGATKFGRVAARKLMPDTQAPYRAGSSQPISR